jgi:hypothetical protein
VSRGFGCVRLCPIKKGPDTFIQKSGLNVSGPFLPFYAISRQCFCQGLTFGKVSPLAGQVLLIFHCVTLSRV